MGRPLFGDERCFATIARWPGIGRLGQCGSRADMRELPDWQSFCGIHRTDRDANPGRTRPQPE